MHGHPLSQPHVSLILLKSEFILLSHYTRQWRGHRDSGALRLLNNADLSCIRRLAHL